MRSKFSKYFSFGFSFSVLILLSIFLSEAGHCQEPAGPDPAKSSFQLFYRDMEPKQLFQILSEIYHVQFDEGTATVTGPINLISPGEQMVDLAGMLDLLNEVLAEQNKAATREDHLIRIVQRLGTESRWISLNRASAAEVVPFLADLYLAKSPDSAEEAGKVSLIKLHPNQPNRILLIGPTKVLDEIEELVVGQLDIAPGPAAPGQTVVDDNVPVAIRSILLQHAPLDDVVGFLSEVYLASPDDSQSQLLRRAYLIKAYPQLQKILLVGPGSVLDEIEQLVRSELDLPQASIEQLPSAPPMPKKYFRLEYLDAEVFKQVLESDESLAGQFIAHLAPEPSNTLIVAGKDDAIFEKIEQMRQTFDIDQLELRYIKLHNAQAAEIAAFLQQAYPPEAAPLPIELAQARRQLAELGEDAMFDRMSNALIAQGLADPDIRDRLGRELSQVAIGELTIVPDATRNALLIRTFSRNFPKIIELVDLLDQPRDQVMIEVFITQVTLDDTVEIGVAYDYEDTPKYNNSTYYISQVSGVRSSLLGLSYELISDNINAYFRALQRMDNLDVITRPQIVTKDNSPAVISLGRDVPIVTLTKVSPEGAVTSDIRYEPVATELKVTPQIHPNNYVTLAIEQTIDDVGAERFQISEDFNPQVIIRRKAQTQLRVKDGQTVCLGGFISDNMVENETGVPLLMDIPILGYLFKFSSKQRVKTEMILFLTPHILSSDYDMLRMTNAQKRARTTSRSRDDDELDLLEQEPDLRPPPYRGQLPDRPEGDSAAAPTEPAETP